MTVKAGGMAEHLNGEQRAPPIGRSQCEPHPRPTRPTEFVAKNSSNRERRHDDDGRMARISSDWYWVPRQSNGSEWKTWWRRRSD